MTRWLDEPWAKPEMLMASLDQVYREALKAGKIQSEELATAKKVMALRSWTESSVKLEHVASAVEQLKLRYIPKGVDPGPGFVFPVYDATGTLERTHFRLQPGNRFGIDRYLQTGDKDNFVGPVWVGTDEDTLEAIINGGEVLITEGPFDLLAIRALQAPIPSLSPLTKKLGEQHWDYLRILGVTKIYAMFDNEEKGRKSMAFLENNSFGIEVEELSCPAKDPAKALEHPAKAKQLRELLKVSANQTQSHLEEIE